MRRRRTPGFWVQGVRVTSGEACALLPCGRRRVVCSQPSDGEVHVASLPAGTALEIPSIGTLCHGEYWRGRKGSRVDVVQVASTLRPRARTAYLIRAAATRNDVATMIAVLLHHGVPTRTRAAMLRRNKHLQPALVRLAVSDDSQLSYFEFARLLTDEHAIELLAEHLRTEPWSLCSVLYQFAEHGFLDSYRRWVAFVITEYVASSVVHPGIMMRHLISHSEAAPSQVLAVIIESVLDTASDVVSRSFIDGLLNATDDQIGVAAACLERCIATAVDAERATRAAALRSHLLEQHSQRSPFVKPVGPAVPVRRKPRAQTRRFELEHLPLRELGESIQSSDALVREVATERGVLNATEALRDPSPRVRAAAVAHVSDQAVLDGLTSWVQPPSVLLAVIEKSRAVEPLERLLEEVSERSGPLAELVASRTHRRLAELRLARLATDSMHRYEPVVARAVIARISDRDLLCELAMSPHPDLADQAAQRLQEVTSGPRA